MFIVLHNNSDKTAVIKDVTEIAGYINEPVRQLRKALKGKKRLVIGNFTIIEPDYVQSKSNSGGLRDSKREDY